MKPLVALAKRIYRGTPYQPIRELYFKAFCRLVRGKRVTSVVDGLAFDLDLSEMIDVSVYLGLWEPEVTRGIDRYCSPGSQVLDIGANIGAHTMRLAKLAGPTGRVFAFEPTNFAYQKLLRNIELNGFQNSIAVQVALSDKSLAAQLVNFRSSWQTAGGHANSESLVDFVRLDDWWALHGSERVDLVKIDVDGNEYGVITGGYELFQKFRPVMLMEAVGPHFDNPNRNPFALLEAIGYRFRDAKSDQVYENWSALQRLLPAGDAGMTTSLNIIASVESAR